MGALLSVIGRVLDLILKWIDAGATDAEILERLSNPAGVGRHLIAAVRRRRTLIESFVQNG